MSVDDSDTSLNGLEWETWQRATQTRGFSAISDINYDAAAMPSLKAVCYGYYPSIELESMLLIKCKKCGLILKDVGYGHHMRSQHGYRVDSSSGDECQSFLLSPPHRVVSPRLVDTPILSPPYRRLSTSITSPRENSGRNGSIISRTISPRYSVEQKDDLKLSLRVSRREASSEIVASSAALSNGTKEKVQVVNTKITRRLNDKMKDKKRKKRRRDSSEEDNFSLEHFRQKKRLSKKGQNGEEMTASASSNVQVAQHGTGVSVCNGEATASCQNTDTSNDINGIPCEAPTQTSSAPASVLNDITSQPVIIPRSIDSTERLQEEEETLETNKQMEVLANCAEQWNGIGLDADAILSQDVATCPTLKSEKDETQQTWATDPAVLSMEDSALSQICDDSESNRFYVPSPPQLSPVAEKECYMESVTAPIISPQTDICHDQMEEDVLLQPRERLVPNGYREVVDLARSSSLHPADDLDVSGYGAVRRGCVMLDEDEEDEDTSDGDIDTHHRIEERIVATGPCLYNLPRGEVPEDARNRRLLHDQDGYIGGEFEHRAHPMVQQKICVPHQQSRCPQLVSVAFMPQKRSGRTCSSPPLGELCADGVSYRDVYIDQEQKIYYPNARLLTVPINGKTAVDYPPQTRSSPPDIFSTEQNQGVHDLPDDVERSPQLPSVHGNVTEGIRGDTHEPLQLALVSQEPQQHFEQLSYNLPAERSRLSSGRSSAVKIAADAASEHPFDYSSLTPVNVYDTRSSNYLPQMARRKEYATRVIRTVRSHMDGSQQPATSQVTPHEVCVPIHGRSASRPELRYVYLQSKSSRSADLDHIYNRQSKDRERETNEFVCADVRHVEHQSRAEPAIRQVAIQKVQPAVLNRIRSSAVESVRSMNVSTHRRVNHHRSSSGAEASNFSISSVPEVVRINSKDRMYDACGLHSYAAAGGIQRGTNAVNKSKQRSSYSPAYQIQQNSASRQMRRAKVGPPVDDLDSRFPTDYVGPHLLNNGMVRDCSSFALSMENRPNVTPGITVQTAQLRSASFAGIRTGGGRTVTVVPVPVLAKCSNSTYYNDSYQTSNFGTAPSSSANPSIVPVSPFASESRTF